MKYIKISLMIFTISLTLTSLNIFGLDGYANFSAIELPAFSKEKVMGSGTKTYDGQQYYFNAGIRTSSTGKTGNIQLKTKGLTGVASNLTTGYITLGSQDTSTWVDNVENIFIGTYQIIGRRKEFVASTSVHSGNWFLNDNLVPKN